MAKQGMKPASELPLCSACNGSGWFSDFDIDYGSSRFGTCSFCAGTGRQIFGFSKNDARRLSDLRTMRDTYQNWQLSALKSEVLYVGAFYMGRAGVLAVVDCVIETLESYAWMHWQNQDREKRDKFRDGLEILDTLLPAGNPYNDAAPSFWREFQLVERNCCCRDVYALLQFIQLVETLPKEGSPEDARFLENIRTMQAAWTRKQGWRDEQWKPRDICVLRYSGDAFVSGLEALLHARRFLVSRPDVRPALESNLAAQYRLEGLADLWRAFWNFRSGLYGRRESKQSESELRTCACQCFRARLHSARAALEQLIPEKGSQEQKMILAALAPHKERVQREIARIEAWLAKPWPIEEIWLMVLMHAYWVQAGKPEGVYAAGALEMLYNACYPKPRRAISAEERARFVPREGDVPNRLNGLTPELLADLHDCVRKFGVEDGSEPIRRLSLRNPKEIHIAVSTVQEHRGIIIVGPGGTTSAGADGFGFVGDPPAIVIWDKRVTLDDIVAFIKHADEIMAKRGCLNPATGERTFVVSEQSAPKKLRVADVFANVGACLPVFSSGPNAETLLQQFDHPEELFVNTDPFGGQTICHLRDRVYLAERSRVATRLLKSKGLETPEDIGRLSFQDVIQLRKEIEQQLPNG